MKVKLRTIYASPERTAQPGQVIDVSPDEGAELVKGGYASPVEVAVETTEAPAQENTAMRKAKRRT